MRFPAGVAVLLCERKQFVSPGNGAGLERMLLKPFVSTTCPSGMIAGGLTFASLLIMLILLECNVERRKSDAELGLNPQQAAGRSVYDAFCDR